MEIKIRAFHKKDKYMSYDKPNGWIINCLDDISDTWEIMIWTGVVDKHGKKIYEGDIVRLPNSDECVIKYAETRFEAVPISSKFGVNSYNCWTSNSCEVIGNVYEKI